MDLAQSILAFFNYPLFTAFGVATSVLEVIAFVAGAACVYGLAKQYMWNWPVAIINAGAFLFLFVEVGLYADAFLQLVFIALSAYGWWYWSFGGNKHAKRPGAVVPVRRLWGTEAWMLGAAMAGITVFAAIFLHLNTDSTVFWFDGFILAGSLVATYMQTKKIIESWWIWIAVDVISIPLYFYKGLALTGILYVVFMALCVKGLIEWRKVLRYQRTAAYDLTTHVEVQDV